MRFHADYERSELPAAPDATEVLVQLDVHDVYDVSEVNMGFSVRCHLKQWFRDPRLQVRWRLQTLQCFSPARFH